MKELAFVVGLAAVSVLVIGYLQKNRKRIILLNVLSRALYILQYVLLFAFEGAVQEIAGIVAAFLAQRKDTPLIKKRVKLVFAGSCILIVAMGLLTYKSFISLFPIVGVLLQTGALWLSDEKWIRRISLLGVPFWFVYNVSSGSFGGCAGDMMSVVSIVTAMIKYDVRRNKPHNGVKTN